MGSVWVSADRCKGCGTCIDVCPENVFEIQEIRGRNVSVPIAEENCFTCRACQVRCPEDAIGEVSWIDKN